MIFWHVRPSWRSIRWALTFWIFSLLAIVAGEPQPLAILAAGAGWLTGALILLRDLEGAPRIPKR